MRFKFEPGFELVWSDRDMARAIGSATSAEIGVRVPWTSEYLPPIAMTLMLIDAKVLDGTSEEIFLPMVDEQ